MAGSLIDGFLELYRYLSLKPTGDSKSSQNNNQSKSQNKEAEYPELQDGKVGERRTQKF
jgi:hypothetical protein